MFSSAVKAYLYVYCIAHFIAKNRARVFKLLIAQNQFQGINSASLCSLAGRYNNPIPTRFLAPIDCLKIPEQELGEKRGRQQWWAK